MTSNDPTAPKDFPQEADTVGDKQQEAAQDTSAAAAAEALAIGGAALKAGAGEAGAAVPEPAPAAGSVPLTPEQEKLGALARQVEASLVLLDRNASRVSSVAGGIRFSTLQKTQQSLVSELRLLSAQSPDEAAFTAMDGLRDRIDRLTASLSLRPRVRKPREHSPLAADSPGQEGERLPEPQAAAQSSDAVPAPAGPARDLQPASQRAAAPAAEHAAEPAGQPAERSSERSPERSPAQATGPACAAPTASVASVATAVAPGTAGAMRQALIRGMILLAPAPLHLQIEFAPDFPLAEGDPIALAARSHAINRVALGSLRRIQWEAPDRGSLWFGDGDQRRVVAATFDGNGKVQLPPEFRQQQSPPQAPHRQGGQRTDGQRRAGQRPGEQRQDGGLPAGRAGGQRPREELMGPPSPFARQPHQDRRAGNRPGNGPGSGGQRADPRRQRNHSRPTADRVGDGATAAGGAAGAGQGPRPGGVTDRSGRPRGEQPGGGRPGGPGRPGGRDQGRPRDGDSPRSFQAGGAGRGRDRDERQGRSGGSPGGRPVGFPKNSMLADKLRAALAPGKSGADTGRPSDPGQARAGTDSNVAGGSAVGGGAGEGPAGGNGGKEG